MRRIPLLCLLATSVTAAALPAFAAPAPKLRAERVFLECKSPTRLGNVAGLADGPVAWSTTPPPGPVTSGDGCFQADWTNAGEAADDTTQALVMAGTVRGRLDSMNVRLYGLSVGDGEEWDLGVRVTIDGKEVIPWATPITVRSRTSNSGVTSTLEFGLDDIALVGPKHAGEHKIEISVTLEGSGRTGAFGWGATQIPSGLHFNPPLAAVAQLARPKS